MVDLSVHVEATRDNIVAKGKRHEEFLYTANEALKGSEGGYKAYS